MELNIRKLLNAPGTVFTGSDEFDYSARKFPGYNVLRPVHTEMEAKVLGDMVSISFTARALVTAECARCLAPVASEEVIQKEYRVPVSELDEEFPELPILPDGTLDVKEMVYGELLIEVPGVILCSPDCEGLCPRCGELKKNCGCEARQDEPQGDPRLQILKTLITDDDSDIE